MALEDRVTLPTLKLLLVGDSAVGKSRCVGQKCMEPEEEIWMCCSKERDLPGVPVQLTYFSFVSSRSLLLRFTEDQFEPYLDPTIGEQSLPFELPRSLMQASWRWHTPALRVSCALRIVLVVYHQINCFNSLLLGLRNSKYLSMSRTTLLRPKPRNISLAKM